MEVPRSTVTWTRELERRRAAQQVEPGGEGGVVVGGVQFFHQHQDFDSNISAFSGCEGRLARSLGLCIHSRECQNLILIVELQFCNFSLSLSAVFLFQLLCLYVSA